MRSTVPRWKWSGPNVRAYGVRERGEDGPGLLQLPAGRQDLAPLREGEEGLREFGPVPPHPLLAALAGQGLRLGEVGIGSTVIQGDDQLAGRAEGELVVGPEPAALDLQVLPEELASPWGSPG